MFCKNCGNELKDGSVFCEYCGTRVEDIREPEQAAMYERPFEEADETESMRQIIGKNADYYMSWFEKLRNGEKSKMNWASFFFGIFHAGYRNVWKDWLKAVCLPLGIGLGAGLLSGICFFFQPVLGTVFLVVFSASSVWLLIAQILFSRKFNQVYRRHVEQKLAGKNLKPDPSAGRAVLVSLVFAVIYSVIGSFVSAGMVGGMLGSVVSELDDSDFEYWDDSMDSYMEEVPDIDTPAEVPETEEEPDIPTEVPE